METQYYLNVFGHLKFNLDLTKLLREYVDLLRSLKGPGVYRDLKGFMTKDLCL